MARKLIHCDTIADFRGVLASPGAILLDEHEIIEAGTPQQIGPISEAKVQRVDGLVIPPFANIHTHLDLSGVGIKPPSTSFVSWVEETVSPIRKESASEEVRRATSLGIDLALVGGTAMIGDFASTEEVARQVDASSLGGRSFVEMFGLGERQSAAIDSINSLSSQFGISPHAPYSCGLELYRAAFESTKPVATHLAEMQEEIEATMQGTGELVEFAVRLGVRDKTVKCWNKHPVDGVLEILGEGTMIAVHVN
jgi:cytosine/adenosine deaminase-related metal-dependent hydrolase